MSGKGGSRKPLPAKKKRFSASLLGQFTYCPRYAWFLYNGVPEHYEGDSLKRMREGKDAHREFADLVGKHIRKEGLVVKALSLLVFAGIVLVLWWIMFGAQG